ncbi:MAG: S8 family serine peptidase [Chloroflexota bacterium]|nr:S8 family serine peptidase [Chloroflexota bacterium]
MLCAVALVVGSLLHGAALAPAGRLVEVIVRVEAGTSIADARRTVVALGGQVGRPLAIVGGFAAAVPSAALARLTASPAVASVSANYSVQLLHEVNGFDAETAAGSMYNVAWQIGAREYWSNGFTGQGIDVAVIDSGVSPVEGLNRDGQVAHGPDLSFERLNPHLRHLDTYGHGTHMAGIIAGRDAGVDQGSLSQEHDRFVGIAPGARVVSLKVANALGATDVSQVIAAIDWVVTHANDDGLNIRVLNLSFGTDGRQDYRTDPLTHAVEQAWRAGIFVVVAAGNSGPTAGGLNNPAYDPFVMAVGADNTRGTKRVSDDVVASFSSSGDGQRNPDVLAPGRRVVSLRVPGSHLDNEHPDSRLNERFVPGSGTSQAAAVVSGAAALVLQQRPRLTPDELKQLLRSTAKRLPDAPESAQGKGLISLSDAFGAPTPLGYVQTAQPSSGGGSLEAARGSIHVVGADGYVLSGEVGVETVPHWFVCATDASLDGNSWSGNSWSGNSWSGNSWSGGPSTDGNSWSATGWLGVSWGKKPKLGK